MKLRQGLHLVASGRAGCDLTDALDCNVYLLQTSAGSILFDSGAGCDADAVMEEIRRDGIDPDTITTLFLTHAHADHSGGVEPLRARLPRIRVATGPRTAEILAQKDETLISLDRARGRFYPDDYQWTAPVVDWVLEPEASRMVGDLGVTLVETPGHSDDHSCYLLRRDGWSALVSGDAVFAGGKVILQDIPDCSVSRSLATIRKLAGLAFEIFLPGHGCFSLADGQRHVQAAMRFAELGVPPPQLF